MIRPIIFSPRNSGLSSMRGAVSARQLRSTPVACKTMTEKVSEVADTVNKKVGKGLASAIETGEKVTEKAKKASGASGQKTDQAAAGAKEAKENIKNEVKK